MKTSFKRADPLLLNQQITDDERAVRDAAHSYCQERLLPRVLDAFRNEKTDTSIFREMGAQAQPEDDATRHGRRHKLGQPGRHSANVAALEMLRWLSLKVYCKGTWMLSVPQYALKLRCTNLASSLLIRRQRRPHKPEN
jgi:hypothetical protein